MSQNVKIVKIRGVGAGVQSIREVPLSWWTNANKPGSGNEKDVADWKIIPDKGSFNPVIIEPVAEKSPEEIMKEAEEVVAEAPKEKVKKSKAVDAKI